ncbi:hypothetical protein HG535_0C01860 [Zygotorulaspora mrakii]|uniref:Uncharacterized protein n=1 Tax=Zygotorulaspora mrakii TaxID=42260 RepID=A0A7H9B048_ZYGMR|nr:uncharacterized protein HG535_0C01860 [Zygotorulaspora mrakii]QLG71837.1 hypothetical protein HG535_0C01860 [Zygotorulaspora mrakii]
MSTPIYANKTLPVSPSFPTGTTSKRLNFKIWFHQTLFREEYDDHFKNDEIISLDEMDDLSLVPSFKKSPSCSTPSSNISSASNIAKNQVTEDKSSQFKRHRLKNLRKRLKVKIHHFRHRPVEKSVELLKVNETCKASTVEETVEWFNLFTDISNNFETLFKDNLKREFDVDESLDELRNINLPYGNENEIIQKLGLTDKSSKNHEVVRPDSQDDAQDTVIKHSLDRALGSIKRNSSDEMFEGTIRKRQCPKMAKEEEGFSVDNGNPPSLASGFTISDLDSVAKAPPLYLTGLANSGGFKKDGALSETVDSLKIINTGAKGSKDEYSSVSTIYRKSTSSDSTASANLVKVFTIPTFRSKNGSVNITSMVKEIESKKLDDRQLVRLARTGLVSRETLSFKDKRFYDDDDYDDVSVNSHEHQSSNVTDSGPEDEKSEIHETTEARVTFNQYSSLVVYKPSKNCQSTKNTVKFMSEQVADSPQNLKIQQAIPEPPQKQEAKSILKIRPNSKEQEENKRATSCDKVDVSAFLDYFEKFESKRQSEGSNLGRFRDRQLTHYYSELFFPELLQNWKKSEHVDTDYTKSKKATELNIGRKIIVTPE